MRYLKRDSDKKLGKNIATLRKVAGFSQEVLAEKLNISQRALCSYECGKASVPVFLIPEIAEILKTPIVNLLDVKTPLLDERTREARILRELEKVNKLPEDDRKVIFTLIDSLAAKHAKTE